MFDSTNDGNLDIVTRNFTNLPQGLNCVTWNNAVMEAQKPRLTTVTVTVLLLSVKYLAVGTFQWRRAC